MADTFPISWRTVFRGEAGQDGKGVGMLSAMLGVLCGMSGE
jgi:hypothetical protein